MNNYSINKHRIKTRVSFKEVEMWPFNTCKGLNIFVIMEQTIATLFARVLKVQYLMG